MAALALMAFLPACGLEGPGRYEFTAWDDDANVAVNRELFGDVGSFWTRPYRNMYAPLAYTLWAGVARVAGDGPGQLNSGVFHIANVVLHAAGAVVVLVLLARCGLRPWPAVAGAAVWAVHPLQLEPVVWITGFRDVLSGVLGLAAIAAVQTRRQGDKETRRPEAASWLVGTMLFAASLLAKPSAMVLPVITGILLIGVMKRPWRRVSPWLGLWMMLAVLAAVVAQRVQPASIVAQAPLWARPLVVADAAGFYLRKIVAPVGMVIDYGRSPTWLLGQGPWRWSWAVPAAVAAGAWWMRRRWPGAWWGLAIMVAGLLPVLGFVRFDFQRHSTVADRYTYLGMLGIALAIGSLAGRATSPDRGKKGRPGAALLLGAVVAAIVAALFGLTWWQIGQWHNSRTLFEATLRPNPTSLAGNNGLGLIYMQQRQWELMRDCFERALVRDPEDSVTHSNYGVGLLAWGKAAEAAEHLKVALPQQPYPWVYNNLSVALARAGKIDEALAVSAEAATKFPDVPEIHFSQAELLMLKGDRPAAAEAYRRALKLRPGWPAAEARLREAEGE